MATAPAVSNREPLGRGGILFIALTGATSALGYYGLFYMGAGVILGLIFGDSHNSVLVRIWGWLSGGFFFSSFFGIITTPASLFLVAVGSIFPVSQRAKIIAWLIALGGALGWYVGVHHLSSGW